MWKILVILSFVFASCSSSRHLTRSETSVDSSVIKELKDSIQLYRNTINFYEQVLQAKSDAEIQFLHDTLYRDTGRIVNKVIVRSDGTIEAEGRIKSLNLSKIQQSQTISRQEETIDSFAVEVDKLKADLSKKQEVKELVKEKRYIPWWVALLIIPGFVFWLYERKMPR